MIRPRYTGLSLGPLWVAGLLLTALSARPLNAQWSGLVGIESRLFPDAPLARGQERIGASLAFRPEYYRDWADGDQRFTFEAFMRLDFSDGNRTHFDIRELSWQLAAEAWELRLGIRTIFWGVTESQHLVDIINQTDLVEGPDGEDKLGQLMANFALIRGWGTLDFLVMTFFRERTFPGDDGRFRPILPVDTRNPEFESSAEHLHLDWAVRWSHSVGYWDIGISHFSGTSREPRLVPRRGEDGDAVLVPRYDLIDQTGLDLQLTKGGWLWKLEAITRAGQGDRFAAFTGGFEYTLVGILGSNADLGLLTEYLFDSRGHLAATPFEDDVFFGGRLAMNDVQSTEFLAGVILDREDQASLFTVEGSRRMGDAWTLSVEARAFVGISPADPLYGMRKDDFFRLVFERHF